MQSKEDFDKLFSVNTKLVCGGELDGLKKEYESYTKYGLLDEIRKLRFEVKNLKRSLCNACKLIVNFSDSCPLETCNYDLSCEENCGKQGKSDCWQDYFAVVSKALERVNTSIEGTKRYKK